MPRARGTPGGNCVADAEAAGLATTVDLAGVAGFEGRGGHVTGVRLGDLPGVGMTIIDGIVRTQRSRNTPPATKVPDIVGH